MAIAFRSASFANSMTGTEPTGAASGDLLVAVVSADNPATGPAGWTQIGSTLTSTGGIAGNIWGIIRGGSAPSYVWAGGSAWGGVDISAYSGAASFGASASSASQSNVSPTVTSVAANSMLVCCYAEQASTTSTTPAGMTKRSVGALNYCAELALPSPGATGTKTWGSPGTPVGAWSVVLEAAATATPGQPLPSPTPPQRQGVNAFRAQPSGILGMPPPVSYPLPGAETLFHKTPQMLGPRGFRPLEVGWIGITPGAPIAVYIPPLPGAEFAPSRAPQRGGIFAFRPTPQAWPDALGALPAPPPRAMTSGGLVTYTRTGGARVTFTRPDGGIVTFTRPDGAHVSWD